MRRVAPAVSLGFAVALALSASPAFATVVNITTSVTANTSWGPTASGAAVTGDVFWVQNNINVNSGVTLTIYPGTLIKFSSGVTVNVQGSVQANGSNVSHIIMTSYRDDNHGGDTNGDGSSTTPAPSDWGGFTFTSMAPDSSRLIFCDIYFGGYYQRGVLQFQPNISGAVTDCTILRCYSGIDCLGNSSPVLVGTTINTSTATPVIVDFTSAPVLSNLAFSTGDNGYDAFGLRGGTLTTTATLPKRGATLGLNPIANVTYVLLNTITINSPGSLTINPGVVIKPVAAYGIQVNSGANLTMNGTSVDTITVTSINDDNFGQPRDTNNNGSITAPHPGDWAYIAFAQGATGSLQYARLKFGTSNNSVGLVDMTNQNIGISNTVLSDASHGVTMHGPCTPVLNNDVIANMTSTPTLMSITAAPTFGAITLQSNKYTALGIIGEQVGVNAHLTQQTVGGYADITYYVMNAQLEMLSPSILTVDPNVIVKFQENVGGLIIDGGLIANGTLANPIVFTSERDDQWGNPQDTNGDGNTTQAAVGDWYYIHFTGTAISASCQMTYCRVQFAGYAPANPYPPGVWVTSCNPTISNSMIYRAYYGLRCDGGAQPVFGVSDTIQNSYYAPIAMSVQSDPTFSASNIYLQNAINGILLISETMSGNGIVKYRPQVAFPPPNNNVVFAYVTNGSITVPTGVTLAIAPQVVIKPYNSSTSFIVNGTLNAIGSDNGPGQIVFTSYLDDSYSGDTNNDNSATSPAVGNWYTAFQFNSTSTSNLVRNCLFQFGGGGGPTNGVINTASASPLVKRSTFMLDRTALLFDGASNPTVDSIAVLNFTATPVSMSLLANPTFGPTITIQGTPASSYTAIGLLGETYAQNVHTTLRNLGNITNIPYAPTGTIDIAFGATWTIDPGVVVKLGRVFYDPFGSSIQIDGAMNANGTALAPIVFTSMADDFFGGDTYSDGASTSPLANQWGNIYFTSTSQPVNIVMNNVILRYGGYGSVGGLRMTSVNPSFSNMLVTACGEGIRIEGNAAPTFTNVNVDSCGLPVRMSLVSNPTFNNVLFRSCNITALGVINETIAQDLLWKIRSVSQRLNIPYYIDGQLGIGLGSTVTMQPGVIVKLWSSGTIDVNRGLIAIGRTQPESLIVFTSSRDDFYGGRTDTSSVTNSPAMQNWYAVQVEATALSANTRFHNCVFRYGGYSTTQGVLRAINSTFAIDSCIFAYNSVGVSVEGSGNPSVTGSSLYGNFYDAVVNNGTAFCTNATGNWWGAANGPSDTNAAADVCGAGATNAGSGDKVTNNVNYTGWATTGLVNPLLGDCTLNGAVTAYDASYVLQKLASLISFSPLQTLVGDVDNSGSIANPDASFILQLVAGVIPALPANHANGQKVPPGMFSAQTMISRMQSGSFDVQLGAAVRSGSEWLLPVMVTGTGTIYGAELQLAGGVAATLSAVDVAGGALMAFNAADGTDRIALAAASPLPSGALVTLHFPAGTSTSLDAPSLTWARVNYQEISFAPPAPAAPSVSFLGLPRPNPAQGPMQISFTLGTSDAGSRARVEVLDVAGRRVRTLADGALTVGTHDLTWDLRDGGGAGVHAGFYLIRARAGSFTSVRRVVVVR